MRARHTAAWFHSPGSAGSAANGTLTVSVDETGDVFEVPVAATVVANPAVGTSLVLAPRAA